MLFSVNGVGTQLVGASRVRRLGPCRQYDAVESVVFLFLPLIPYKGLHVLAEWGDAKDSAKSRFQSVPLKFTAKLALTACLRRCGCLLMFLGCFASVPAGIGLATMDREFTDTDRNFLFGAGGLALFGLLLWLCYFALARNGERIKDILGAHDLGHLDPFDLQADLATAVATALENSHHAALEEIADQELANKNFPKAMFVTRLCQNLRPSSRADQLFAQLIQSRQRTDEVGQWLPPATSLPGLVSPAPPPTSPTVVVPKPVPRRLPQLVGSLCVACHRKIESALEGEFCPICTCPVHDACRRPYSTPADPKHCAHCGATPEQVQETKPHSEPILPSQPWKPDPVAGGILAVAGGGVLVMFSLVMPGGVYVKGTIVGIGILVGGASLLVQHYRKPP